MSRLHQIHLQYDAHQDRARLHLRTNDSVEFRFWLTRRYVKILWAVLLKMVEADAQLVAPDNPAAREAVVAFRHEQAVQKLDFKTEYEKGEVARPLGDTPVLLAKVQHKQRVGADTTSSNTLVLAPLKGQGIEVNLDTSMVHSLCKLLVGVSEKAQWGLGLKIDHATTAQTNPPRPEHIN
jgi:hypothetical protein